MAQNDALTFYVRFMEDQNNTINNLVEKLANQLRSMVVHLDSRNIDVSGLKTELGKLEGAKVVDQESLTKAKNSIQEIGDLLKKAFNGSDKGGENFPGILQSLKDINTEIGKVVNKMGEMHTAISSIGSGMSTNVGNAIVNNMTQIVEATGRAISKVQELNELAGKNLGGKRAHKEEEKIIPPTLGLSSTNFKSEAEQIMKTYEEVEKRMQQKIKSIQDTIAKFPKDTFIKNPVNREWMKQEMDDVERLQRHLLSLLGVIEKFSSVQTPNRIIKFDEPVKQMTTEERNARQWMYNSLFNSREAIAMQNSVDTAGMEKARTKAAEIREQMDKINEAIARTNDQNLIQGATAAHQRLEKIHSELENISKTGGSSGGKSYAEYSKGTDIKEAVSQGDKVVKDINTAIEKARKAADEAKGKQIKANKDAADAELQRLKKIMRDLNSIQAKSPKLQIEGMDKAKQELQTLIELLQRAKKEGTSISGIDFGKFGYSNVNATLAELSRNQQTAALDAMQHAQAQQRMEQAIANATSKAQQQSQVLSDLRSMAAQYLSVWGATSFVKEVAQITGELELQQRSLEVILGSAGQAQELYSEIKVLSQMSPFTFQDLLKSTRQLAAFGVETKDLYGTMKSLSDLGAGLNVDVQRLILAYGHVKSAGVLSGIQRRQFETAGINITGEIAKLYNQRFKQAGSDERVSNADIFKKITKREIGFEDVEQAISRMTAPGGRFYNMQLRQFETLGGKLRNLRNNYNIMLDEIGKSYNGIFSGGVDSMNSMMENWRTWEKLIKSVTVALVAAKVASMALGKSWTAMRAAQNTMRQMRYEAQALGTTMSPVQTAAMSTTYAQSIVSNKDLNKFQKLRAILRPSVSADDRYLAASMITGNEKYAEQVRGMNKWQLATQRLKLGFQSFFSTLKAGFMAIATNPLVWLTAAVAAVTALTSKARELEQMRENATRNAVNLAGTDIRNLDKDFASLAGELGNKTDDGGWKLDRQKLDAYGVDNAFQQLDEMLQKYDPLYKGHIFDAKMIEDDYERVLKMFDDLEAARAGKKAWKESAAGVFQANTESGYGEDAAWWNLGLKGNWGQWDTAIDEAKEYQSALLDIRGEVMAHEEELQRYINNALNNNFEGVRTYQREGLTKAANEISNYMKQYNLDFDAALQRYISEGGRLVLHTSEFDIDTSGLQNKLNSFTDKAQGMVGAMNAKLRKMFKDGAKDKDMASYLQESFNAIFSVEGKEITDPEAVAKLQEALMEMFSPPEGASEEMEEKWKSSIGAAIDTLYSTMASAKLDEVVKMSVDVGAIGEGSDAGTIISTVEPQMKAYFDAIVSKIEDPAQKARIQAVFDKFWSGFRADPTPAVQKFDQAWKKLYTKITDPNDPRAWLVKKFNVEFKAATDETQFWIDMNKKFNEIKKSVKERSQIIDVVLKTRINFDAIVNAQAAAQVVQKLYSLMEKLRKEGKNNQVLELGTLFDAVYDMYQFFKAAEKTGHSLHDSGGGSHKGSSGGGRHGSGSSSGSGENKAKKAAEEAASREERFYEERLKWINDLRRAYKDNLKNMNPVEAWEKATSAYLKQYPDREKGPLKGLDLNNRDSFDKYFDSIIDGVIADIRKSDAFKKLEKVDKGKGNELIDKLVRRSEEVRLGLENIAFEEKKGKASISINNIMEAISKDFEKATKVFDATRNTELAQELAKQIVFDGTQTLSEILADNLANLTTIGGVEEIPDSLIDAMRALTDEKVKEIVKLPDDAIEQYAKDLVGDENLAQYSEVIGKWLVEIKKVFEKRQDEAVAAYVSALSSRKDYTSQLTKIEGDLKNQEKLLKESGANPQTVESLMKMLSSRAGLEMLKLDPMYARFMESDVTMNPVDMRAMFDNLFGRYKDIFESGGMSGEEMGKQTQDLIDKMRAFTKGQISNILDFSRMGYLTKQYNEAMEEYLSAIRASYLAQEGLRKANEEVKEALLKYETARDVYNKDEDIAEQISSYYDIKKEIDELLDKAQKEPNGAKRSNIQQDINDKQEELNDLLKEFPDLLKFVEAYEKNRDKAKANYDNAVQNRDRMKADVESDTGVSDAWDKVVKSLQKIMGQEKLKTVFDKVVGHLNTFKNALSLVNDTLEAFGVDTSGSTGAATDLLGGMLGGASSLSALGPWGMAAGAALGLAGSLAQLHDKNLQRQIDKIKEDTTKMSNTLESIRALRERTLGYDRGDLRRYLADYYTTQAGPGIELPGMMGKIYRNSATAAMAEYYGRYSLGNGYEQELSLLEQQRQKIMDMYNLEDSKKKKSKEDLEEYKTQIAELDEQITFFVQDLANELWGIDLKGWADQLSDSLMTAFENGSSAAKAFKDTVQDIMRGVVKNMLTVGVIEPALQKLQEKLFGKNGKGGIFDSDNVSGTIGATLNALGEWFNSEGPALMNAANEFFNGADDMMRQALGYGMLESERSTSTTTSITSTASEETMGIVAGYLSRVSQDVSVQRIIQEMFVNGSWPDYIEQVTSANNSLSAIDQSTTAMMEMMRDGNGALYERVENMSRRLDNFANGIDTITMR